MKISLRRILVALVLLGCWPSRRAAAAITDNFNRASLGTNYDAAGGTIWDIVSSTYIKAVSTSSNTAIRRSETSFPDNQYAQAEVSTTTGGDYNNGGPMVRMDSSGNGYFCKANASDDIIYLFKRVAGVDTSIGAVVGSTPINYDTFYTLKISATGSTLKVFVEGIEEISVTDTDLTTGKPGLKAATSADTTKFTQFDDFECTDAVSASIAPLLSLMQLIH